MSLILDSSATLAWVFPGEKTTAIQDVFNLIAEDGAVVPLDERLRDAAEREGVLLMGK